jgi:ERCC4-type nuclease
MKMIKIYADMRETTSGILTTLKGMEGVEIQVGELPSGDFVIHESTCVERKTAVDFINSIMDGRLFNQVAKMKNEFANPIIIIEGDVFKTRSKMSKASLMGAISYCAVVERVTVIPTSNTNETAELIFMMAKQLQIGLSNEVNMRVQKPKPYAHMAQYLVEGLPGIGPTFADRLLKHFKSPLAVFMASVESLQQVAGMGKKRAEGINTALRYEVDASEVPVNLANKD